MYLAWFYIAWTLRIEHKPKCICPCLSSHNRIFQICYPTDFDFNHNLSPENPPQTPRCRDKPLGLSLSCWTDLKVCPYVYSSRKPDREFFCEDLLRKLSTRKI